MAQQPAGGRGWVVGVGGWGGGRAAAGRVGAACAAVVRFEGTARVREVPSDFLLELEAHGADGGGGGAGGGGEKGEKACDGKGVWLVYTV